MLWLKMGWRNLLRNPSRTAVQLLAVSGSLFLAIFMVNIQVGSYDQMIEAGVKMGSGHLAFYHPGYLSERKVEQCFSPDEVLEKLDGDRRVKAVFPRLHIPGLARSSYNNRPVLLWGLDFPREVELFPLLDKKHLIEGKIPENSKTHVLIGEKLAKDLGIALGKKFVLMFQDGKGEISSKLLRVGGMFRTGISQIDGGTILIERKSMDSTFGKAGKVHELAVILHDRKSLPEVIRDLRSLSWKEKEMKCYPWQEAMPEIYDAMRMDRVQGWFILSILFLIVAIGTTNTLLMSIMERTREFGLMRALGLPSPSIRRIILTEALILAMVGVFIGLFAGLLVSYYYHVNDMDFRWMMEEIEVAGILFEPVIRTQWDVRSMLFFTSAMFLLVFAASFYPTRHALGIRPAQAMRQF